MDSTRLFAGVILAVSSFLLVQEWLTENREKNAVDQVSQEPEIKSILEDTNAVDLPQPNVAVPERSDLNLDSTPSDDMAPYTSAFGGERIVVKTDTLEVVFDTLGPEIVKVELLNHPSKESKNSNFVILNKTPNHFYTAQIGLIGENLPNHKDIFYTKNRSYTLSETEDTLIVDFSIEKKDIILNHVFKFTRGSYLIEVLSETKNLRQEPVRAHAYYQLVRDNTNPSGNSMMLPTYTGVALFTEESKYKKIDFEDIKKGEKKYPQIASDGWIAIIQHYFLGGWIPEENETREYYTRYQKNDLYSVGVILPLQTVDSGQTVSVENRLYVGPQDQDKLSEISKGLNLTVDYGWLTIIASPLFDLLQWIHKFVGNWGWSIVVLTIIIKLIFYPLSAASYKSMAKMRVVAPKLQKLKELYGNDKQRMQQEMMALYKKEQINPLGGCLPILVQIPVFIALYWVLLASVELRYAPFLLWIDDLSAKDPYYILPVLMGLSMIVQTRLNPTPPDPVQAKIMKIMPVVFSAFFFFFPAGLVLYWLANNILSIAQQWRITKVIEGKTKSNGRT